MEADENKIVYSQELLFLRFHQNKEKSIERSEKIAKKSLSF